MIGPIERLARRLLIWAMDRRIAALCEFPPGNLYGVIEREVASIDTSIAVAAEWHFDEVEILTARLTRRYDVGMAMNEATQRAQAARRARGEEPDGPQLTANQKAALKFQVQYLKRIQGQP